MRFVALVLVLLGVAMILPTFHQWWPGDGRVHVFGLVVWGSLAVFIVCGYWLWWRTPLVVRNLSVRVHLGRIVIGTLSLMVFLDCLLGIAESLGMSN
jgi:hypothetical protein